jgi:Carbohydrate family 9 binding domain-like
MKKVFFATVFCEILLLCVSALAGQSKIKNIYELDFRGTPAKQWKCIPSGIVSISSNTKGGMHNTGSLIFKFNRPSKKGVQVIGPTMILPECGKFVTSRRLVVNMNVKSKNLADLSIEVRVKLNTGKWATPMRPRRNWKSIIHMIKSSNWKDWSNQIEQGLIYNNTRSATLYFLITNPQGKGVIELDKLVVSDISITNHRISSGKTGNVFYKDNGKLTVQMVAPEKLKTGEIILLNEEKKIIKRYNLKSNPGIITVKLPGKGFYELEASGKYSDGTTILTKITSAVVGKKIPDSIRRQSRYGVMRVHADVEWALNTGSNIDWGFWRIEEMVLDAKGQPKLKKKIKPHKRKLFLISGMDSILPGWLRSPKAKGHGLYPPRDWKLFGKTIETWAKNNPNLPDIITVYNEPDAHWRGSREDYVRFHNVVARAIKKARPEAKVGGPAMYSIRMKRLKEDIKMGLLKDLDCLIMHAYVNASAPEGEFIERIIELNKYMRKIGKGDMPIYLTEFGWTSSSEGWQKPVDELTKARYCARSLILCTKENIAGLIYFCGRWLSSRAYSIVKKDYTPTPAYSAFCTLVRQMSEIKGGGQWIQLSPTTNWVAFKKGKKTLLTLWNTVGERKVGLPVIPESIVNMTGGKVNISGKQVKISPSPIYISLKSDIFSKLKVLKKINLLPGDKHKLIADKILLFGGIKSIKQNIFVPDNIELGNYAVLLKNHENWSVLPVEIKSPLKLKVVGIEWTSKNPILKLVVKATSTFPTPVLATLKVNPNKGQDSVFKLSLAPNKPLQKLLPLQNILEGYRYKGKIFLQIEKPVKWQVNNDFDVTFLSCPVLKSLPNKNIWTKIKAIDFSSWETGLVKIQPNDLSASFKVACAPEGFCLQVIVKDNQQVQDAWWSNMWRDDSIQLGIDMDVDKPWQANNVGYGLMGHRVIEYGFSKKKDGTTMAWRWRAYAPGIKTGPPFDMMKKQKVTRDEKNQMTIYDIMIPWKSLGADRCPPVGSRIGFSLAVNDKDKNKKRQVIRIFGGITNGKDPKKYGKITLIKPVFKY